MQEPYNYETLLAELKAQPDLHTAMDNAVWYGEVFALGTWRRAVWEATVPNPASDRTLAHAVAWACYLHPRDELDVHAAVLRWLSVNVGYFRTHPPRTPLDKLSVAHSYIIAQALFFNNDSLRDVWPHYVAFEQYVCPVFRAAP